MNAMTRRHPVVLFVYYVMTLVLLIVAGHPLLYGLLLLLMGIDVSLNRGFLKMLKSFVGSLTVAALCVVVNPLLNHRGMTVLFYLNENAVTKEAVLYGCYMAVVLLGTIFSVFRFFTCDDFRKDYDDVRKKISFFFTAFFHDSSYGAKGKKRFFTDDFTAWKSSACVVCTAW